MDCRLFSAFPLSWVSCECGCVNIYLSLYFQFFGCMYTRRGTAGPYGNSVFNVVRNPHMVFHSSCIFLHPYQQCTGFSFSTSLSIFAIVCFVLVLIAAVIMGTRWYLTVVLISGSFSQLVPQEGTVFYLPAYLALKIHLVKATVFSSSHVRMWELRMWRLRAKELIISNCGGREDSWESLGLQAEQTSPP